MKWSAWHKFPNPMIGGYIQAPFGCGVYQLRNSKTDEYVLFGKGKHVAYRMSSLLPKPYGHGTRNNEQKKKYVWVHIDDMEYRTMALRDERECKQVEREIKKNYMYIFNEKRG